MPDTPPAPDARRLRREPPTFRRLAVAGHRRFGPRLERVTLAGPELAGFTLDLPAASVRLLLPPPEAPMLELPVWNGNEFLLADGRRPVLRTLTPRHLRPDAGELDVDVVLHGPSPASRWAAGCEPGSPVALSGPGRGYAIDPAVEEVLLAGDESAIPAVSQLLEALAPQVAVRVHLEVSGDDAEVSLPEHPGAMVTWWTAPIDAPPGQALLDAVAGSELGPRTAVWAAGEAAGMQRLRRHLFDERAVARSRATVRGYWKVGRAAEPDDA